jgi:TrmH family RNA methyltransferase
MITSSKNDQLKLIRKLQRKSFRQQTGLFVAEGEDLIDAAAQAGVRAKKVLVAGRDVEEGLLAQVSMLGSGTKAMGIYRQRYSNPGGEVSVFLDAVQDPANIGGVIRCAHAFSDGPVTLGPGCADPYSPRAVRASMGSVFARPPALAEIDELSATPIALDSGFDTDLCDIAIQTPFVLCLGAERKGLSQQVLRHVSKRARIPMRTDGPPSLNVAQTAAIALYESTRMAGCG